jgi:hypothetical protein
VMDVCWCPTDPVTESPTVLQSNLQQSMTDGEGGRAAKALAERRGSFGLGRARAPNDINLGWLKEGLSDGRGQTSVLTCFRISTKIRHLGNLRVCHRGARLQESRRDSGLGIRPMLFAQQLPYPQKRKELGNWVPEPLENSGRLLATP